MAVGRGKGRLGARSLNQSKNIAVKAMQGKAWLEHVITFDFRFGRKKAPPNAYCVKNLYTIKAEKMYLCTYLLLLSSLL